MNASISFLAIATGVLAITLTTAWWWVRTRPASFNYPVYGAEDLTASELVAKFTYQADELLSEAYKKFQGGIFQLLTRDGVRLFLPKKYAEELKAYPRHHLSGMKALADRHLGQYTTIDHESEYMLNAIKLDMNQNLGKFVPDVQSEVAFAFETLFPPCEDWTPVDLNADLLRIVSMASARIFVGPSLNRSREWLDITERFATDVMVGGEKLKTWKPFLRPIAQYLIPEVRRIRTDHEEAYRLLYPVLRTRAQPEAKEHSKRSNDMIQWIQTRAEAKQDRSVDYREQANIQLLTATAAIHTTRLAIIHALFDLAAYPTHVQPLREELRDVLHDNAGVLTKQSLTQLKKLDSFMKESQRLSPASLATIQRKVMKPVTLSNGLELPRGAIVQCSTSILDEVPSSWGNPHEFDGFRFHRLRSNPEDTHRFQFASPTLEVPGFGLGKDACPGRFFASNQIKIILAHIIQNYDIALEKPEQGRPKNIMFEVNVLADPTAKILFRRRRTNAS